MSGGVDSSVAALLMKDRGFDCSGVTMKLYNNEDAGVSSTKTCCSLDDIEDAGLVASRLGMPYYVFNFTDEFREKVMMRFADAYLHGLTPNPCIDCNRYLKFRRLYLRSRELGYDCIVTGHYATVEEKDGRFYLKKGLDDTKDQSYVLYPITQEELSHTVFPLGTLTKKEVREIAEAHDFINAHKADSQDICFVPDGDYAAAVERLTGVKPTPGKFVDKNGNVLGEHRGIIHYTIGQRKGLLPTLPGKMYVCNVCPEDNTVILGTSADLFGTKATITELNWISGIAPTEPFRCKAKTRYRQKEMPATVTPLPNGDIEIEFDEPVRAITPGQAAVLYDGEYVLGGGTIAVSKEQ